jgi:hypothetical protein
MSKIYYVMWGKGVYVDVVQLSNYSISEPQNVNGVL